MKRWQWMGVGGALGGVVATLALALQGGRAPGTTKFVPYAPRPLPEPVPATTTAVNRPNFLLVIADDLGQDQVGAYHVHPTPPPTRRLLPLGLVPGHRVGRDSLPWPGSRSARIS